MYRERRYCLRLCMMMGFSGVDSICSWFSVMIDFTFVGLVKSGTISPVCEQTVVQKQSKVYGKRSV